MTAMLSAKNIKNTESRNSVLQPGDLIFYADNGYVYHVVLYAGSGPYGKDTVIQAEETGTPISYTPIPPDPYAAGRP